MCDVDPDKRNGQRGHGSYHGPYFNCRFERKNSLVYLFSGTHYPHILPYFNNFHFTHIGNSTMSKYR